MSIYAANLLHELVDAGHDVTMISQYYDGDHATVYGGGPPPSVPGVKVIGLPALGEQDGGDFERDIETMRAALAREHALAPFDVLHAQYGYPTGWAVLLAAADLGVPCLVSIQGGDGHWVGSCCVTHHEAFHRVLMQAGALLIGGESFIAEVSSRMGVPAARFTRVPGAVDTNRFTPRRPAGALRARPRVLYHGRVDRRKGVLDFIAAVALLRDEGLDCEALVSGIGPDVEAARAHAADLSLDPARLRFAGYADYAATPSLYAEADIFASPTYAEGFSNTILEAMATGLPVASCDVVGVTDCLRHGENGLLTPAGDVAAHAAALRRLIEDTPLRIRLAEAALEECRARYSWSVVGRTIMELYARLAGTRPATAFERSLTPSDCRFRARPHLL
jgi:glycosyltransferase involved in cell wall biosynthesis